MIKIAQTDKIGLLYWTFTHYLHTGYVAYILSSEFYLFILFFTVYMLVRLFWQHNIETVGLFWNVICVAYSAGGMCTHAARMLSHGTVRVVFCDPGQT